MSKELEDIFKDGFELDTGKFYINVLSLLTKNQAYLISILKRQVEIKEILNGKVGQELDESSREKIEALILKIDDYAEQSYNERIQNILK